MYSAGAVALSLAFCRCRWAESSILQVQLGRVVHFAGASVQSCTLQEHVCSLALCRCTCLDLLVQLCRVVHSLLVQLYRSLSSAGAAVQSLQSAGAAVQSQQSAGAAVQSLQSADAVVQFCTLLGQLCRVLHSVDAAVLSCVVCRSGCAKSCILQLQLCRSLHSLGAVLQSAGAAVPSLTICG